ncbi:MAG TPA: hypothetical protein IAB68_03190 [Candidatus Aphodocola excrementigallinarum]|uniref:Uncharacterized protein n=1 Tax=Candidatus Aphodocola excrementigallinarum TaxID=2840670 RepID=A0A9D1IQD7_9FIRM|nr:hypothetical protein [Candidatus Aphodocola excrementigallinarum]
MKDSETKEFVKKVKVESAYRKFIKKDIIYKIINIYDKNFNKQSYPNKIDDPLKIALDFYKNYNINYYNIIINGLRNKRIVISKENGKSFVDKENNKSFIRIYDNDADVYVIVHELAHFIDGNSNPKIVPNQYWFLSEVFSFYMEKKLELYLKNEKYSDLISARINNRMYYESKMVEAIKNELWYEDLYRKNGVIKKEDIYIKKIKTIIKYDIECNIVNYLLMYPVANILSDKLIKDAIITNDNELVKECLNMNLYDVLEDYQQGAMIK